MDIQLQDKTLGQWMEHWAETTPDKEYLVYSDRDLRFTWKEFNERVDRMAKGMLSIGIKHGTHVGIWATNVPDWLTFLYAAAKIGAVAVTSIPTTSRANWNSWSKTRISIHYALPTACSTEVMSTWYIPCCPN